MILLHTSATQRSNQFLILYIISFENGKQTASVPQIINSCRSCPIQLSFILYSPLHSDKYKRKMFFYLIFLLSLLIQSVLFNVNMTKSSYCIFERLEAERKNNQIKLKEIPSSVILKSVYITLSKSKKISAPLYISLSSRHLLTLLYFLHISLMLSYRLKWKIKNCVYLLNIHGIF